MESTAPTFILCCTEGAGLEDVLEFVPRVQRDHMQKEHNTKQTQFAPLKKKQEINTSLYIQIHRHKYIHRHISEVFGKTTHISEVFDKTIAISYPSFL